VALVRTDVSEEPIPTIIRLIRISELLLRTDVSENALYHLQGCLLRARATWYKVPEGIYDRYRHESIPKESVLRQQIVSLYGEAE
jgi:hypothetical protein